MEKICEYENIPVYYSSSQEENNLLICRGPEGEKTSQPGLVYWDPVNGLMSKEDGSRYIPDYREVVIKYFITGCKTMRKFTEAIEMYKNSEQYKLHTK